MWPAAGDLAAARRQPRTLATRDHRPWPVPDRPWVMGQTWESLLFAHWRADPAELQALVPSQLPLDTFDGTAWIAVTPFVVRGMRARFLPPLPGVARFPEVNVRTYVTLDGRPGIYFFSLDTPNRAAVVAARRVYRLPYFRSAIDVQQSDDAVEITSRRVDPMGPPAALSASYQPTGPPQRAGGGSFAQWATERYCLYTLAHHQALRGEIHHRPWSLQPAKAEFAVNTMAAPLDIPLEGEPVLHFVSRQDVVFWLNGAA